MDQSTINLLLRAVVIGLIITGTHWGLQQLSFFQDASSRARLVIEFVVIFAVAFVVFLLWPLPQ